MTDNNHGLGRLQSDDPNDERFPMRALLSTPPADRKIRHFSDWRWWGDQGDTSQCVEYSWHHWINAGPVFPRKSKPPHWELGSVYREAKTVDEWPGENYDGTSVRAGAKVLQRLGYISSYHWAWDINTLINAALTTGPVVVGTNWYRDMFEPSKEGIAKPTGRLDGGHAYLLTGVNLKRGLFRFKNSWGKHWGLGGRFRMDIADFERLLNEQGEACLAVEERNDG